MTGSDEAREMTLREFVESTWFKGLARACMIIVIPALLSVGSFLVSLMHDVDVLKGNQVVRAGDSERFQAQITGNVNELKATVSSVQSDVAEVKLDVATVKGILQELQRRDIAWRASLPPYADQN